MAVLRQGFDHVERRRDWQLRPKPVAPAIRLSNDAANALVTEIAVLRQLCDELAHAVELYKPKNCVDMTLLAYENMKANRT